MSKFSLKKWGIVFAVIVVSVFTINTIIRSLVSNIVATQVEEINKQGKLKVAVGTIQLNIFAGNLTLKNVWVKPDSLYFESFKQGFSDKATATEFILSELKIRGFSSFDLLVKKEVHANKIIAKGLLVNLFKSDKTIKVEKEAEASKKLDSIFIKGINKIDFKSIVFDDFELKISNVQSNDTLFLYNGKQCEISGINLEEHAAVENYFVVNKENIQVNFDKQEIVTKNGDYKIVLNSIKYNFKTSSVLVSNIKMNSTIEKEQLASTYAYNTEVYQFETDAIQLKGFYLDSILRTGIIKIDTILVEHPIIGIYKDQTKPFNVYKRPEFLNQKLKKLQQPLRIEKLIVNNGLLNYREKHKNFNELMTLDISELSAEISNITSLKSDLKSNDKLTINLKGNVCKVAALNLDIFMSYNTWNNAYSFTGSIGNANFTDFNAAIYPGTGINFSAGNLNSMQFTVQGTPIGSTGKMTMLFENLEADFATKEKNKKGLSWIANAVLVDSNPSKKGKLRVAEIEFERVPYKGFGNLLWKSVLSGMVNTILPVGRNKKIKKQKN